MGVRGFHREAGILGCSGTHSRGSLDVKTLDFGRASRVTPEEDITVRQKRWIECI